jgi:hypothetical protein
MLADCAKMTCTGCSEHAGAGSRNGESSGLVLIVLIRDCLENQRVLDIHWVPRVVGHCDRWLCLDVGQVVQ